MNIEIPYMSEDMTQFFVLSKNFTPYPSGFGLLQTNTLKVLPKQSAYHIPTLLFMFAKQRANEHPSSLYTHIVDCCERPDEITRANPFYTKLFGKPKDTGF